MNTVRPIGDCCTPCDDPTTVLIPGQAGLPGADGADGADGVNAFTYLTDTFTMPAVNGTVAVDVGDTSWMGIDQPLYVENCGMMLVTAIADGNAATFQNLGMPDNVAPGTPVNLGAKVSPGAYLPWEVDDHFIWDSTADALGLGKAPDVDAWLQIVASAADKPQINLEEGAAPAVPANGDIWADATTHNLHAVFGNLQRRVEWMLFSTTANKDVVNTASETSVLGTGVGTLTLPVNSLAVGSSIRIRLWGVYTFSVATVSTFRLKLGATTYVSLPVTLGSGTAAYFRIVLILQCRTVGGGGTALGQGSLLVETPPGFVGSGNTVATAVDTTAVNALDVTVQMSVATASNGWTCTNAEVVIS